MAVDPGPWLTTDRLVLRTWHDRDLEPYAALCADPEVMRYFPWTMNRDDFDHPAVDEGHPMRRVVLYRLRADDLRAGLALHP